MGTSACSQCSHVGAVEAEYDIQHWRNGKEQAIGVGATSEVWPCTHMDTHALRAVKTIDKIDWNTRAHVVKEIDMLRAVSGKHSNIITFVEYYEEWGSMSLIFEYCPGGTLEEKLSSEKYPVGEALAARLAWQLLSALEFLHSEGILHRDVKPANLLLADDKTLKLADFGVACYCSEPLTVCEGTPAFFPPEMLQLPRGRGYSFPMDIWAAGITLYMLLFAGAHPFHHRGCVNKEMLRSGEFEVGWFTSKRLVDVLQWMLMPNPDQRVRADEACEHPWFASYSLGSGSLKKERPKPKLVLDSHGNWRKSQ